VKDISKLVKDIDPHKGSGLEHVKGNALKTFLLSSVDFFTKILNKSFEDSIFPKSWARACITPLPKSGDLKLAANWRPISILPTPGKIAEKLAHKQIYTHLNLQKLLTQNQFGYRPTYGTGDAVFKLVNHLYLARDKGNIVACCFIDYKKAFDCVNHHKLLTICQGLKLSNKWNKWLENYLKDRLQCTKLNDTISQARKIIQGVPQGSVLGPLLFIIFMNDVDKVIIDCHCQLYADDIVLYTVCKSGEKAVELLQNDVTRLHKWSENRGLTINSSKSKVMWFGPNKKLKCLPALKICINDVPLPIVNCYTYLSIQLNSSLSFDLHVSGILSRVSHKLHLLSRIRHLLDFRTSCLIYKQTIATHFEYCSYIFGGINEDLQMKLQRCQNRGLRICSQQYDKYTHLDVLHAMCKVEYLAYRRDEQLKVLYYKLSRNYAAMLKPFDDFTKEEVVKQSSNNLENKSVTRSTSSLNVKIPFVRSSFGSKAPVVRGGKLWNAIDNGTQKSPTKEQFKQRLRIEIKGMC
jgi:hypothetical protein